MTTSKYYDEDYKPKSPPKSGEFVLNDRAMKQFKVTRWVEQTTFVDALSPEHAVEIVSNEKWDEWSSGNKAATPDTIHYHTHTFLEEKQWQRAGVVK